MDERRKTGRRAWDPYAVWQLMLRRHPVFVENPAGSCGRIDRSLLSEFFEATCEYPDYLQDALLLIAHAEGVEAAVEALDAAIREHFAATDDQVTGLHSTARL